MFHPSRRLRGDFINAVQELIPTQSIPPHQIAAATDPGTRTEKLITKRRPSRQALERKANRLLSQSIAKPD